jgi:hypothetical protein
MQIFFMFFRHLKKSGQDGARSSPDRHCARAAGGAAMPAAATPGTHTATIDN